MKPPVFDHVVAASAEDAVDRLAKAGGAAKLIAGGQSLMPMLNFRLLEPELLIDVSRLEGFDRIDVDEEAAVLGAGVRHAQALNSQSLAAFSGVFPAALAHVAHRAIRNRGTLGGSLAHADPAAEWPALAALFEAEIAILGPGGRRVLVADEFFEDALTTTLADDEIILEARFPGFRFKSGWGFEETARRRGDFALAGAAALITLAFGRMDVVRLVLFGVEGAPRRMTVVEKRLKGEIWSAELGARTQETIANAVQPFTDLHASADYRAHLAGVLGVRALASAWRRLQ